MTTFVERQDAQRPRVEVAPPIEATYNLETTHAIAPVRDAISKAVISKSNASVSALLQNSLKGALRLSKTLFGNVSQVFRTFNGIRNMIRGPGITRGK